jgi:hypothetical protein
MTITFRGQDLNADGLRLQLTVGYAEPVSVRGKDTIVPGYAGRIARNRIADVRSLRIEGYVSADDAADWRIATDIMAAIFDTRLEPGEIELSDEYLGLASGDTATINARTLNGVGGAIQAGKRLQFWSFELESIDPDWAVEAGGS